MSENKDPSFWVQDENNVNSLVVSYDNYVELERELQEAKDLLNEWQWLFQHLNPALSEKTDNFCEKRSDEL